jgi:hypothetical protein
MKLVLSKTFDLTAFLLVKDEGQIGGESVNLTRTPLSLILEMEIVPFEREAVFKESETGKELETSSTVSEVGNNVRGLIPTNFVSKSESRCKY